MGTAADLQSEWARLAIGSLAQAGVRDAVISPGSRSTPFVVAALEHEGLRCTSGLDERSAGHFALGQARASGRPSLVLCTSGSAPANYFPAVVEANEGGVPLIVLSADRPPELHGRGANQTTDQNQMYGSHARFFANLGEPDGDVESLEALKGIAIAAVRAAVGPRPGPVQLNAQARKPLEPRAGADEEADARHRRVNAVLAAPPTPSSVGADPDKDIVARIIGSLENAKKPLILCGPTDHPGVQKAETLSRLAERSGAIVAAEAASDLRFGNAGGQVLGAFDSIWSTMDVGDDLLPDFILQLGRNPISQAWERLSNSARIPRVVVHPWVNADPSATADAVFHVDIPPLLERLAAHQYESGKLDATFAEDFRRAERVVWEATRKVLSASGDMLTEGAVAPSVCDALPPDSALVLGNSLPIRDVDRWVPPGEKPFVVYTQRGVSGIDGVVSAAAGVASCRDGATTLLIGDVSFLHDVNGLELASHAQVPLVIVVINNAGGRIFEQLPIARSGEETWLPYFTTPHGADLASAASLYGCRFATADSISGFEKALRSGYAKQGCSVIEAVVPPSSARAQAQELAELVQRALAAEVS